MVQYQFELQALHRSCLWRAVSLIAVLLLGMFAMSSLEGWTFAKSFYWATVTVVTVGYGDLVPTSTASKSFTIFYALLGCAVVTLALTDFGTIYLQRII